MKTITAKEYYDRIMAAVEDGTLPSVDFSEVLFDIPSCRYRLGKHKCVAGLLIEDAVYKPEMEAKTISTVLEYWPDCVTKVEGMDLEDLMKIQAYHDSQFIPVDSKWNKQQFIDDINSHPLFRQFAFV